MILGFMHSSECYPEMCQTRECYIGKHTAVISHCRTMKPSHQKTVQKRFEKQNKFFYLSSIIPAFQFAWLAGMAIEKVCKYWIIMLSTEFTQHSQFRILGSQKNIFFQWLMNRRNIRNISTESIFGWNNERKNVFHFLFFQF